MSEENGDSAVRKGQGLVIVYTGNGKGKTTAALGTALRAVGHGMRVLMIQFIKGSRRYGERVSQKYLPGFEIRSMGMGFICDGLSPEDREKHYRAIREAWKTTRTAASSGLYDMIILDELNYVIGNPQLSSVISTEEVVEFIRNKPPSLHLVITGRGAPDQLIEVADLVTEMREIKHPYHLGVKASKGIEF